MVAIWNTTLGWNGLTYQCSMSQLVEFVREHAFNMLINGRQSLWMPQPASIYQFIAHSGNTRTMKEIWKLSLLLKLPPGKFDPWFVRWSFFLQRLLYIFINLPYSHAWNTVVMSGLCRTLGPSFTVSLESLAHRRNVANLSIFY